MQKPCNNEKYVIKSKCIIVQKELYANHITVDLYRIFECIADSRPSTYCAGWELYLLIESNGRIYAKLLLMTLI